MVMFETKRSDGRSYLTVAVEGLKDRKPNEIISYEELGRLLELDERPKIQAVVRQANKKLLKYYQRGLEAAPNQGYRVLHAREHVLAANNREARAERQLAIAERFLLGANLSEMTAVERQIHQNQVMVTAALVSAHRMLAKRVQRLEDILNPNSKTI